MSVNRNNREVTLTFGGVEIKGTLDKELKMSKFKVGDIVLSRIGTEYKVLHVGKESLFVESDSEEFSAGFDYFKPIPTKADIEHEKLIEILKMSQHEIITAYAIQNAGFTIPKKVKRIDIENAIINGLYVDCDVAVDNVYKLLGDLVED